MSEADQKISISWHSLVMKQQQDVAVKLILSCSIRKRHFGVGGWFQVLFWLIQKTKTKVDREGT